MTHDSPADREPRTTQTDRTAVPDGPPRASASHPQRLSPHQSEAPHRRSQREQQAAPARSFTARRFVDDDGVERVLPPAAPIAAAPRALRHLAPPRRRRWWRAAAVTGALVMLPFTPAVQRDELPEGQRAEVGDTDPLEDVALATLEASRIAYRQLDQDPGGPTEVAEPEPERRDAIATLDGLELDRISRETAVIGFHEAYGNTTLSVEPSGPVHENHNPTKSHVEPDATAPVEPKSMVLPPRDRSSGPHSAIDVAMPVGAEVLAPVSGTVVNASQYALYGEHLDNRIEIVPDGRPDVVVIMLHVTGPRVSVGDRVVSGETVVADSATQFPFRSQIDRFAEAEVGQALPHVHIEIKPTV